MYIWYPLQQYSTVHISETTGPNSFKLSQFRQNKSTTSCPSYISIGLREHIISCMWNLQKINYFSSISVLATAFSLVALGWILLSFFLVFWSPLWPCQAISTQQMSNIFTTFGDIQLKFVIFMSLRKTIYMCWNTCLFPY